MFQIHDADIDANQFTTVTDSHPLYPLFCLKPIVNILFYSDYSGTDLGETQAFGLGILKKLIIDNNSFYVDFKIDLVNRHDGGHAAKKLTNALLSQYDEVWFFGVEQANVTTGLQNELTSPEVTALRAWMVTGGVLITGDHANARPSGADTSLDPLLNLGRALGHRIPRAGELRRWEGPPSTAPPNNYNTHVPNPPTNIESLSLQEDAIPQKLILKKYPISSIYSIYRRSRPHPLFCGKNGIIDVYADHGHEGHLNIPTSLGSDWPTVSGHQQRPEIVAWGTDKRNGNRYGIVTAYDGDPANVGRIVADSTWHHHFNINLKGFPKHPDGSPGPVLAQIANFFVNQAVWLAPKSKRRQIACTLFWYATTYPDLQEIRNSGVFYLGGQALDVLGRRVNRCVMEELIYVFWPELVLERYVPLPDPFEIMALGGIVHEYQNAAEMLLTNPRCKAPNPQDLIAKGLKSGAESLVKDIQNGLEVAKDLCRILPCPD